MKPSFFLLSGLLLAACSSSNERSDASIYEPNFRNPYGQPHPDAPDELAQFQFMIGQNDCTEERLNNATGEWDIGTRTWDAQYFMNGYGIRDGGRSGSTTNTNIRIFDSATKQWNVTFFSMPAYGSGVWTGAMEEENIVLRQPQKAPGTDFDGYSTLTFFNITDESFDWSGQWVAGDGSVAFPFWRMSCNKVSR